MRWALTCLCLLISLQSRALQGEWKLHAMIYKGEPMALPNRDLNLRFTFFANGLERLYWDRGTPEFCERFAHYAVSEGYLHEEVFAVNPKNAFECASDPDMQTGRKTQTKIQVEPRQLLLHFQLGEDELIYVLLPAAKKSSEM